MQEPKNEQKISLREEEIVTETNVKEQNQGVDPDSKDFPDDNAE